MRARLLSMVPSAGARLVPISRLEARRGLSGADVLPSRPDPALVVGLHRLALWHSTYNETSWRVDRKAVFNLEGVQRRQVLHRDGCHDTHLHAASTTKPRSEPAHVMVGDCGTRSRPMMTGPSPPNSRGNSSLGRHDFRDETGYERSVSATGCRSVLVVCEARRHSMSCVQPASAKIASATPTRLSP